METSDRPTPTDLTDQFEQTPFAFDFFRAIRLLEARHPTSTRLGTSLDPREDPIRFGQTPSHAFAPSALEAFRRGQGDRPGKMLVRFFGLFGPNGPLPSHITEYAHERQLQAHDNTFVEFCNVFHHRLLSLFYRAWAVNQKSVDFDRAGQVTEQFSRTENWTGPRFPLYIGSFFGLGMPSRSAQRRNFRLGKAVLLRQTRVPDSQCRRTWRDCAGLLRNSDSNSNFYGTVA